MSKISRREFVETTGAGLVVATGVPLSAQQAPPAVPRTTIKLTVNGAEHRVEVEDRWTLVELLRDHLLLTGTKIGCDRGECHRTGASAMSWTLPSPPAPSRSRSAAGASTA